MRGHLSMDEKGKVVFLFCFFLCFLFGLKAFLRKSPRGRCCMFWDLKSDVTRKSDVRWFVRLLWLHSFRMEQLPSWDLFPHLPRLWDQEKLSPRNTLGTSTYPAIQPHPTQHASMMVLAGDPETRQSPRVVRRLPGNKMREQGRGSCPPLRGEPGRALCLSLRLEKRGGGRRGGARRRRSRRDRAEREGSARSPKTTWTRRIDQTRTTSRAVWVRTETQLIWLTKLILLLITGLSLITSCCDWWFMRFTHTPVGFPGENRTVPELRLNT